MKWDDVWGIGVALGVILVAMVLHELAHGLMAYALGDTTAKEEGRLSLNPLKHLDPIMSVALPLVLYILGGPVFGAAKPVPINTRNLKFGEWGMALVGLAGPLMNLLLAFVAFLIGHFTGWLYSGGLVGDAFLQMVVINLGLMVFNLIPIPPLDGSRVLYAVAPDGARRFLAQFELYGVWVVYFLILAFGGVFGSIMSGAIQGILRAFYWWYGWYGGGRLWNGMGCDIMKVSLVAA